MKRYISFEFSEANIEQSRKYFLEEYDRYSGKGYEILFARYFPPCILPEKVQTISGDGIIFDESTVLFDNNMFYGKKFIEINKRFSRSPFISERCKSCGSFRKFICRGLMNDRFYSKKSYIISRRGSDEYDAIRLEYFEGQFGTSSNCNCKCTFCANNDENNTNFLVNVRKELDISEILHFAHYVNFQGARYNFFFHKCVSGEPLLHSDLKKVLEVIRNFCTEDYHVITNGINLDNETIDIISRFKDPHLVLSLNSSDETTRKKMMNCSESIDFERILRAVKKTRMSFNVGVIATSDNIDNGDLKKTILFLEKFGILPNIRDNLVNIHADAAMKKLIGYNQEILKRYLIENSLLELVTYQPDSYDELFSQLDRISEKINKLNVSRDTIILCPSGSYDHIKDKISYGEIIPVDNELGFKITISESVSLRNYVSKIKGISRRFDAIIIPIRTFDAFFNDYENNNISYLLGEYPDKKIILI